jgi:hypothetical protein
VPETPDETLIDVLADRASADGVAWLRDQLDAARAGDRAAVRKAFPGMGRRLGRGELGVEGALARADGAEVPLRAWRVDDVGRAALIAAFADGRDELARELYFSGDLRERTGVLRGLALAGEGDAAMDAVRDACRANARELFEAAVADNPYASAGLNENEFRQAVLKSVFLGVPLESIARIDERADAELTRMLLSYVTEREMAVRSVPPDIWPVAGRAPIPGTVARLVGYLEHPLAAHRAGAARGLGISGDPRGRAFLEERLPRETDESVRAAIAGALA